MHTRDDGTQLRQDHQRLSGSALTREWEPNVHQHDHKLKEFDLADLGWNFSFENSFLELDSPAMIRRVS